MPDQKPEPVVSNKPRELAIGALCLVIGYFASSAAQNYFYQPTTPLASPSPTPQSQASQTPPSQPPTPQVSQTLPSVTPTFGILPPQELIRVRSRDGEIFRLRIKDATVPTGKTSETLDLSDYKDALRRMFTDRGISVPKDGGLSRENIKALFDAEILLRKPGGRVVIDEIALSDLLKNPPQPTPTPTPSPTTRP